MLPLKVGHRVLQQVQDKPFPSSQSLPARPLCSAASTRLTPASNPFAVPHGLQTTSPPSRLAGPRSAPASPSHPFPPSRAAVVFCHTSAWHLLLAPLRCLPHLPCPWAASASHPGTAFSAVFPPSPPLAPDNSHNLSGSVNTRSVPCSLVDVSRHCLIQPPGPPRVFVLGTNRERGSSVHVCPTTHRGATGF